MPNNKPQKKEAAMAFLEKLFLTGAESNEPQEIISIRAHEEGLDHCEIVTKGEKTSWRHRIFTEEA
jgi:hypothetical protein